MGIEKQLSRDFLACVQGGADEVGDTYKKMYDGVTLPGMTVDGRYGASVNHKTLAGGIALYKESKIGPVLDWWASVAAHWKAKGNFFIEDGTRNVYFYWILMPMLAALKNGCDPIQPCINSTWARLALGASSETARFGRVMQVPQGTWRGYATTFVGARSWKYNDPHWSHLEKNATDWLLYWAVENSTRQNPGQHWAAQCIDAGLGHGLDPDQSHDLGAVIYGDTSSLDSVVDMLNGCGPMAPCEIVRTERGVATMYTKSFNGNTQFLYGAMFDHATRWHQWLAHGDGSRKTKHGTAHSNGIIMECVSNDGLEGPVLIDYPKGRVVYRVFCPDKAGAWRVEGATAPPQPPVDPEPPVVNPPNNTGGGLSQADRMYYSDEIGQMAKRQLQLAEYMEVSNNEAEDRYVAEQLGHQSNKANRLSTEITEKLDA